MPDETRFRSDHLPHSGPLGPAPFDPDRLEREIEAAVARFSGAVEAPPLADALGPEVMAAVRRARDQVRQRRAEPFTVAFIGALKRGKSTLVNAVVGEPALAMSPTPETMAITELRYDPSFKAELRLADGSRCPVGREDLPADRLQALVEPLGERFSHLDVEAPVRELRDVRWVDTPGTNDLFNRFDERVRRYLSAADLVVVLTHAPPSASEQAFLRAAIPPHDAPKLVFVVNMVDQIRTGEDVQRLVAAVRSRCAALCPGAPVFPLSARDELARRLGESARDPARAESHAALFDAFRRMLTESVVSNRRAIRLDRMAALGSRMLSGFTEQVELLQAALGADGDQLERGIAACHDDAGTGAAQLATHKAALLTETDALRQQTAAWMERFLDRLDSELPAALAHSAPDDIDRHARFFIADRLRQALDACLAAHQPAFDALMRGTIDRLRRELAAQGSLAAPKVLPALLQGARWRAEHTASTVAELLLGMGPLAGILSHSLLGAHPARLAGDALVQLRLVGHLPRAVPFVRAAPVG